METNDPSERLFTPLELKEIQDLDQQTIDAVWKMLCEDSDLNAAILEAANRFVGTDPDVKAAFISGISVISSIAIERYWKSRVAQIDYPELPSGESSEPETV